MNKKRKKSDKNFIENYAFVHHSEKVHCAHPARECNSIIDLVYAECQRHLWSCPIVQEKNDKLWIFFLLRQWIAIGTKSQ